MVRQSFNREMEDPAQAPPDNRPKIRGALPIQRVPDMQVVGAMDTCAHISPLYRVPLKDALSDG